MVQSVSLAGNVMRSGVFLVTAVRLSLYSIVRAATMQLNQLANTVVFPLLMSLWLGDGVHEMDASARLFRVHRVLNVSRRA